MVAAMKDLSSLEVLLPRGGSLERLLAAGTSEPFGEGRLRALAGREQALVRNPAATTQGDRHAAYVGHAFNQTSWMRSRAHTA